MGSSAKRKKEKKKDFQKPKLKVGKAKPKADNQTDTSFRAKAIVLNQQSLNIAAPTESHQFQHHLSLLTSKSDTQRKDALSFLAKYLSVYPVDKALPVPTGTLLEKICPLILDGSSSVRSQVQKVLQSFKHEELKDHVVKLLPFIRAGMTHLSRDVRNSTVDLLSWLLGIAGEEVVSCPGGWQKTLESFVTLLGWRSLDDLNKWTSGKATFGSEAKATARFMQALDLLLQSGFELDASNKAIDGSGEKAAMFPFWHMDQHQIPHKSDAFLQLNLFGTARTDDNLMMEDPEDRLRVFNDQFRDGILVGIATAKSEGGELGRAAGLLTRTLKQTSQTT